MNGMLAVDQPLTVTETERLRAVFRELWPAHWQNIIIVHGQSVQGLGPTEYKDVAIIDPDITNATWPNCEVATNG